MPLSPKMVGLRFQAAARAAARSRPPQRADPAVLAAVLATYSPGEGLQPSRPSQGVYPRPQLREMDSLDRRHTLGRRRAMSPGADDLTWRRDEVVAHPKRG